MYSNTMASQSIKKIGTFKETIQGKTIAEFTKDGSDQEYYQIKCEIKQNGK
ncbi:MAG: hypothetical protein PHY32_03090 [Candidatus Pacebacteria bacterium]|nr:hypothetical protein [Candidatus Paceibacterota bacterium]